MFNVLLWYIYIRPYVLENGEWIPSRSTAKVPRSCQPCPPCDGSAPCTSYDALMGGELWALYDDSRNGSNSYEIIRRLATEIMTKHGYKLDDIKILAEMNKSAAILPRY